MVLKLVTILFKCTIDLDSFNLVPFLQCIRFSSCSITDKLKNWFGTIEGQQSYNMMFNATANHVMDVVRYRGNSF